MGYLSRISTDHGPLARTAVDDNALAALSGAEWSDLTTTAIEPSITADPAWVVPALNQLAPDHPAELVSMKAGLDLAGVAVMERTRWRWGIPMTALVTWSHAHHFLGTPLVSARNPVQGFADLIQRGEVLLFTRMTLAGPAMAALREAVAHTGASLYVTSSHQRACYRPDGSFADYLATAFPRKRRKEFRRLRNRLGDCGTLMLKRLQPGDDVEIWFDRFEALEAAGWKGRRRTALAHDPASARFLRAVGHRLRVNDRLLFWELSLDEKPLAMLFAMISGPQAWLGKIAYDENFARFSPGVLLMLDVTADLDRRSDIALVDSCAVPDHPMIDHLWHDRLLIGDLLVTPRDMPQWQGRALHLLETGRNNTLAALRSLKLSLSRRNGNGSLPVSHRDRSPGAASAPAIQDPPPSR